MLCSIAIGFAAVGFRAWQHELRLVRDGISVDARVYAVNYQARTGVSFDPSNPASLQFPWRGGLYTTRHEKPLEGYGRFVTVGDTVRVKVDPVNPENWTAVSQAIPLRDRMMDAMLTLPAILLTLLAAIGRARGS